METIIGREEEINEITELYNSGRAEFLAIYGRRRVGKTFLVKEVLGSKFTFYHTGLSPIDEESSKTSMKDQLLNFYFSLVRSGMDECAKPQSWLEAFFMLENHLEDIDDGSRQVIFIDELPWMDTPKSGFLKAVEAFWNGWASGRHNVMLVVCGSATTWMLDNIVNNHGGLYDRLTREMHLHPFRLKETAAFLKSKGIVFSDMDIAEAQMIFGGIPYYLGYFRKGMSLAQNVDALLFDRKARLVHEFRRLFSSLFSHASEYSGIVRFLAQRRMGFTRKEIADALGRKSGGTLSGMLASLEYSEFVRHYTPLGYRKSEVLYQLCDPFCLFYLTFVEGSTDHHYWLNSRNDGKVAAWRGLAFEALCANHIDEIKNALKVGGVLSRETSAIIKGDGDDRGTQIDLVIIRDDNVVNLCEMKFTAKPFVIDREYADTLQHRIDVLRACLGDDNKSIHLTFVTSKGVKENMYSGIVQSEVKLEDLF